MSIFTPTNQIRFTNVAIVRHKVKGKKFEIACYRNKINSWRRGVEESISEVLQTVQVFKDASKGLVATKGEILECYGTDDLEQVCIKILEKGNYQLSDKEREEALRSMFRDIACLVASQVVSPADMLPYPQTIVEKAMREVHYNVNMLKSAKQQVRDVISKIKAVLPVVEVKMKLRLVVQDCEEGVVLMNRCLEHAATVLSTGFSADGKRESSFVVMPGSLNILKKLLANYSPLSFYHSLTVEETAEK